MLLDYHQAHRKKNRVHFEGRAELTSEAVEESPERGGHQNVAIGVFSVPGEVWQLSEVAPVHKKVKRHF